MKTKQILSIAAFCAMMAGGISVANAQETVVVEQTTVVDVTNVECKNYSATSWRDNWFIQLGAGIQSPFVENKMADGKYGRHHLTPVYGIGFGHWFSPYLGFRISGNYGLARWNNIPEAQINLERSNQNTVARVANLNADLMWDMTSSCCGINPTRVFSFIPFVGIGGTYTQVYRGRVGATPDDSHRGHVKTKEWSVPVSAGFQLRFRCSQLIDLFAEGRATIYPDNFNTVTYADPIEANFSAMGGISFNINGRRFKTVNPCDYVGYINTLNGQVNDLRADLAATNAALAAAQAQLPCPEATPAPVTNAKAKATPMLATVRFRINSAVIFNDELVNVYNIAEWLKANPEANITIEGYADRDTGTSAYNEKLSQRRANAVYNMLVNKYGINPDRLNIKAYGSSEQPYPTNNWNRIVTFSQP